MVTSAVLPARGSPTWIRWPPIMIAPRDDTRRLTCKGPGSRGDPAVPARSAQPRPGVLGDRAGDGADHGPSGQDADDRPVQPERDPPSGHSITLGDLNYRDTGKDLQDRPVSARPGSAPEALTGVSR